MTTRLRSCDDSVIGISGFLTVIGVIALVGWVADQTLRDLQQIWRSRGRRHHSTR
jgi:hypothetical protein